MSKQPNIPPNRAHEEGQSLVEYALIVTLVIITFGLALAATGPVIANIFSNTVFNLVGQDPRTLAELPNAQEFWGTVTAAAGYEPVARARPTNTLPPATPIPTQGTPPTATPITPTATPTNTWTPSPSPTPQDIGHVAPWFDSANPNQLAHWRVDNSSTYFGSEDWIGFYYPNSTFTPPHEPPVFNADIAPEFFQRIDFNWGNNAPAPVAGAANAFSVVFRRPILLTEKTTLEFNVSVLRNGRFRVWILGGAFGGSTDLYSGGPGNCSAQTNRWNVSLPVRFADTQQLNNPGWSTITNAFFDTNPLTASGNVNRVNRNDKWTVYDDGYFRYNPDTSPDSAIPTECLLIDRWMYENADRSLWGVRRTVPAGQYVIQVDYAHRDWDGSNRTARLNGLNIYKVKSTANVDDTQVNNSGVPRSGLVQCDWRNRESVRADTLSFFWDESVSRWFPSNTRCHLELRGWVEIPAGMPNPALRFRDVWDMRSTALGWLEIADYDPDNDGVFDRNALNWQRVNIRQGDSFNYNWTENVVPLDPYLVGSTSRKLTFRFVMERRSGSPSAEMKWFIDTISIDTFAPKTFYTNMSWNLNDYAQRNDFIASGHWDLTSEHTMGAGMSWHESPGFSTRRLYEARNTAEDPSRYLPENMRIHWLEFNGFIDLDDVRGMTDDDGDQGDPLLTFFHSYQLSTRTGLEIQYSTTPYGVGPAVWQPVPLTGVLVARNNTTTEPTLGTFEQVIINLKEINQQQFRLRFALLIDHNTTERGGWWIDNIKLERQGRTQFLRYPYIDTAEDPAQLFDRYLLSGSWDRVAGGYNPPIGETGHAYTDSPTGNYSANTNNLIVFKEIFDLFNDTPENSKSPSCNLAPSLCETPNPTPNNPMFTFWHRRIVGAGVTFAVEWRRNSESNSSWRTLWQYNSDVSTVRSSTMSGVSTDVTRPRWNEAWERVEISLAPIENQLLADNPNARTNTDNNFADDDIVLRIRFQTLGSSTNDGIYIDDIRIEDRPNLSWQLWELDEQRTNNAGQTILSSTGAPALGSGKTYYDTFDNTAWYDIWHIGGGWRTIAWEQKEGLLAFHDSVTDPTSLTNSAPAFNLDGKSSEGTNGAIANRTYNVLEMRTIIDLRGVQVSERPVMYFWTRYYGGGGDYFVAQLSFEDPNSTTGCTGGATQCYEKQHGWSEWQTVWQVSNDRRYTWERQQIDLSPYARSTLQDGRRIRVRFVTDALTSTTHRDGWYLDSITFTHYNPNVFIISKTAAAGGAFIDRARNTSNWVMEGRWGLTPTIFRGSGGGPASLGGNPWYRRIWDRDTIRTSAISNCNSLAFRDCANLFLQLPDATLNAITPWTQGFVSEVRTNWGTSSGPIKDSTSSTRVNDRFTARYEMTTPTNLTPGKYTILLRSDDGARMRYDTVPPGNLPTPEPDDPLVFRSGNYWNIVDNWVNQTATTIVSSVRIEAFRQYKFVVEYFEDTGSALIDLSVGSFSFSFTSATPTGTGRLQTDQVATMRNSNSSMISKGVFDLSQATNPYISYYHYHELGGTALFEVSVDGGFTWTQNNLEGMPPPNSIWATPWIGYFWNSNTALDFSLGWNAPSSTFTTAHNFNGTAQKRISATNEDINYNFGSGRPFGYTNVSVDNFSARWIRRLATTDFITLKFRTISNDGVRLWVNYTPGCADRFSGSPNGGRANHSRPDPDTSCLIIDDWENQGGGWMSATRTIPPGAWLMLDYYESTGYASIRLDIVAGNFDRPTHGGTYTPDRGDWSRRIHDLTAYAGPGSPPIAIRFRVDRRFESNDTQSVDANNVGGATFNYLIGWWVTDIEIIDP